MMSIQLIFVVETNKKCDSDWIYIKNTVEHFYTWDSWNIKLTRVYMDGKNKYKSKEKEIQRNIKQFKQHSRNGESIVIYCFDCDNYDNNPLDKRFLEEASNYCRCLGYKFVWFCRDVEDVYLGRRIDSALKKKESAKFASNCKIKTVTERKLRSNHYAEKTSNILTILDEISELKKRS